MALFNFFGNHQTSSKVLAKSDLQPPHHTIRNINSRHTEVGVPSAGAQGAQCRRLVTDFQIWIGTGLPTLVESGM